MKKTLLLLAALSMLLFPLIASADIVLPESLVVIDDEAFSGCPGLSGTLIVPEGVTEIGESAFADCDGLTELILPATLETIEDRAFAGCTALAGTVVDSGVQVGEDAFDGTEIIVAAPSPAEDFEYAVNADGTVTITKYIGSCEDGVVSIPATFEGKPVTVIGDAAFSGLSSLNAIYLPDTVTGIGGYAFSSCSSLKAVYGSGNVTSYGTMAFYDCAKLSSLKISDQVCAIDNSAFYGTSLTNLLYIADEYRHSGINVNNSFAGSSMSVCFYTITAEKTATITKYIGAPQGGDAVIPGSIDGCPVTLIGQEAFFDNDKVISVTLPGTVTALEANAFDNCSQLTSVYGSKNIVRFGNYAFAENASLSEIQISENVEYLGSGVFLNCAQLKNELLLSADSIDLTQGTPFNGSDVVAFLFSVNDGSATLEGCCARDNKKDIVTVPTAYRGLPVTAVAEYAFHKWGSSVPARKFILPDTIVTIGAAAFMQTDVDEVVLPASLESIADSAFLRSTLKTIHLPESLKKIGEGAFSGCANLTSITLPDNLETIGMTPFSDSGITSINVPASWTELPRYCFYGMSLTEFTIPAHITAIGQCALAYNTKLTSIVIPETVTTFGDYLLCGCTSLTDVTLPDTMTAIPSCAFTDCTSLTSIDLPDSITSCGLMAFSGCTSLDYVELPPNLTHIPTCAFDNSGVRTKAVEKVVAQCITDDMSAFEKALALHDWLTEHADYSSYRTFFGAEGVLVYGEGVCQSYTDAYAMLLDAVGIPVKPVVSTPMDHTWNLVQLGGEWYHIDVTWDDPVGGTETHQYFGLSDALMSKDHTWDNPSELPAATGTRYQYGVDNRPGEPEVDPSPAEDFEYAVNADGTVTITKYIGSCEDGIVSIPPTFEDKPVTVIGEKAFFGNVEIQTVYIPKTVTEIGESAFSMSSRLKAVYGSDHVTTYGAMAFEYCSELSVLTISDQVSTIGNYAFSSTLLKQTLHLPESYRNNSIWPDYAFDGSQISALFYDVTDEGTAKITLCNGDFDGGELSIPETFAGVPVTAVGERAFISNVTITSVVLPSTITDIGESAFYWCSQLQTVDCSNSRVSFGADCFVGCESLKAVYHAQNATSYGDYAFQGCTKLEEIQLNGDAKHWGQFVFYECEQLKTTVLLNADSIDLTQESPFTKTGVLAYVFSVNGDSAILEGCCSRGNLLDTATIPSQYKGLPVTAIADYAFYQTGSSVPAKKVILPETLITIGQYAFQDQQLEEAVLPLSLKKISTWAFADSTLAKINLPEGLREIGWNAFLRCANLTAITLPDSLEVLGDSPFSGSGITSINVPATWTELPPYCFCGMNLTELTIPPHITAIGNCSLAHNTKLTSIVIPETVTTFGPYLFNGCTSLTDVTLPDNMTALPFAAFSLCTSLKTVELPDSITEIGLHAFSGCTSLEKVDIPPKVTVIAACVFENSGIRTGAVARVVAECIADGMTEFEKALALHDWLINNADYTTHCTFSGAEGVLVYGEGVCQSYTDAYAMLLDAVGISHKPVVSAAMDHTWNLVQLDEEWYHVDCTWNDPPNGTEQHIYFGLTDELMGEDHTWDDPPSLPAATGTRYQYGVDNGAK